MAGLKVVLNSFGRRAPSHRALTSQLFLYDSIHLLAFFKLSWHTVDYLDPSFQLWRDRFRPVHAELFSLLISEVRMA